MAALPVWVVKKHGDSLAGCIFSVVQLVVGSPRCGFRDYILYNGLIGQSPKLALQYLMTMSGCTDAEGSHQLDSKRAVHSCRKNVPGTSFVSDLRDHMHEFINASADEHRACFTKTIKKMFGMSKIAAQRWSEAEETGPSSVLPLQTTGSR
ncbi:unnamed protein product [Miscanthus lutarioriparius]|uniref:Uncharacterized protein n=1 Tax=Miscanthus lutarioriparius TaxID=422564 RepID=A0A811MD09_9POAL|nr:unnamed protein product [Miscanthus lutarioriparius]